VDASRKLQVDIADVCIALSGEGGELEWFLDLQTGETLLVNSEYSAEEHGGLTAKQIHHDSLRFKRIPAPRGDELLRDMEAFAGLSQDERLKQSLELALSAPHPERRFRAVLGWIPDEQQRWRSFRQEKLEHRAKSWLSTLGLAV
jgi:hypothetical protein